MRTRPARGVPGALSCTLVVVLLASCAASVAAQEQAASCAHVRPLSRSAKELLDYATAASSIVRGMIDRLENSDVVALVQVANDPFSTPAWMRFVGGSPVSRFVLINLPPHEVRCRTVAMLAHELEHAIEVAAHPAARDGSSVARLFARIGFSAGRGEFETQAATDVEDRVRLEIANRAGTPPVETKSGGKR